MSILALAKINRGWKRRRLFATHMPVSRNPFGNLHLRGCWHLEEGASQALLLPEKNPPSGEDCLALRLSVAGRGLGDGRQTLPEQLLTTCQSDRQATLGQFLPSYGRGFLPSREK